MINNEQRRITQRGKNGRWYAPVGSIFAVRNVVSGLRYEGEAVDRLADFEDAAEQGQLVMLSCKVGDVVWIYCDVFNQVAPYVIDMIQFYGHSSISFYCAWRKSGELMDDIEFDLDDIDKTVFLTSDEAEAALAAREENK